MLFRFFQIWGLDGLRRFDEKPPQAVVCHFEGLDGWGRFDEKPPAAVVVHFQGLGRLDHGDQKSGVSFCELVDVAWNLKPGTNPPFHTTLNFHNKLH